MFSLSFVPTKSNHPERYFLRAMTPHKVPLHRITLDASCHATLAVSSEGV